MHQKPKCRWVERELAPHIVRLRVVAEEHHSELEVVDDHMEEEDPGAQVEENDAEWNAMAIPNIAGARMPRQEYLT